jgi:hypothetical protein
MPIIFLLFLSSCALFFGKETGSESAKGRHYRIHFQDAAWQLLKDDRSDYVFSNQQDGRLLMSNSFCHEFQEQSLEQLAGKTFHGLSESTTSEGQYLDFQGREAYHLRGSGQVDGVKVNLQILNTRRNNCYFDFVAIDPHSVTSSHNTDFEKFLQSVKFK